MAFDYSAVERITNQDFANSARELPDLCRRIAENYAADNKSACCVDARIVNESILQYMYERLVGYSRKAPMAGFILRAPAFTAKVDDIELLMAAEEVQRIGSIYAHPKKYEKETDEQFEARMGQAAERLSIYTETILEKLSTVLERAVAFINDRIPGVRGKLAIRFDHRANPNTGCEECVLIADLTDVRDRREYRYTWRRQGQTAPLGNGWFYRLLRDWLLGEVIVLEAVHTPTGQILHAEYGPIRQEEITPRNGQPATPPPPAAQKPAPAAKAEAVQPAAPPTPAAQGPAPAAKAKAAQPAEPVPKVPDTEPAKPVPAAIAEASQPAEPVTDVRDAEPEAPAPAAKAKVPQPAAAPVLLESRGQLLDAGALVRLKPAYESKKRDVKEMTGITDPAILRLEVVKADGRQEYGSAFLIHPDGYALTCSHVIAGAQSIKALYRQESGIVHVDCEIINDAGTNLDLALIRLKGVSASRYLHLARRGRRIEKEPCVVTGYQKLGNRMSDEPVSIPVNIIALEQKDALGYPYYLVSDGASIGHSGSPVISLEDGCVIGVLMHSILTNIVPGLVKENNSMRPIECFWPEFTEEKLTDISVECYRYGWDSAREEYCPTPDITRPLSAAELWPYRKVGSSIAHIIHDDGTPKAASEKPAEKKDGRWIDYSSDGSVQYDGEHKDGKRHGWGTYYFENGNRYEGEWEEGLQAGRGTEYYSDDSVKYDGKYKNGKRHGWGTYFFENGNRYEGEWEEDLQAGRGTEYYSDDSVKYDGEFKNGKRHGWGTFYYEDGSIYEGPWVEGVRSGQHGVMYYADGRVYDGEWKDDVRQGDGIEYGPLMAEYAPKGKHGVEKDLAILELEWSWKERAYRYHGKWSAGKKNGRGRQETLSQTEKGDILIVYDGFWQDDKRHGKGDETRYRKEETRDGDENYVRQKEYDGTWENDLLIRAKLYEFRDSGKFIIYDGDLRDELFDGSGTLYRADWRTYVGSFKEGHYAGKGKEYDKDGALIFEASVDGDQWSVDYANGMRYFGTMKNGRREGEGTTWYPDGTEETGRYKKDVFQGGSKETVHRAAPSSAKQSDSVAAPNTKRVKRVYATQEPSHRRGFTPEVPSFLKQKPAEAAPAPKTSAKTTSAQAAKERADSPRAAAASVKKRRKGSLVLRDGSTYDGEILNNVPDGEGIATIDGKQYRTTWEKGVLKQKVLMESASGESAGDVLLDWLNSTGM